MKKVKNMKKLRFQFVICLVLAFTGIKKVPGWDKVGGPEALTKD